MEIPELHKVTELKKLRPGRGISARVNGIEVAAFLVDDEVHVVENLCPHQHIPVLADGELEGNILTCPMHGWQFDVTTGACVHASGSLRRFPVQIVDGDVMISIPEEESPSWW